MKHYKLYLFVAGKGWVEMIDYRDNLAYAQSNAAFFNEHLETFASVFREFAGWSGPDAFQVRVTDEDGKEPPAPYRPRMGRHE
jgi:hypothetical protein